jgi:cobalt-zinc-cadmium efflux system protein
MINDRLPFNEKLKVIQHLKHELLHHNIHHSTIELESETVHCSNENERLEPRSH